jgi:hypothetical protein
MQEGSPLCRAVACFPSHDPSAQCLGSTAVFCIHAFLFWTFTWVPCRGLCITALLAAGVPCESFTAVAALPVCKPLAALRESSLVHCGHACFQAIRHISTCGQCPSSKAATTASVIVLISLHAAKHARMPGSWLCHMHCQVPVACTVDIHTAFVNVRVFDSASARLISLHTASAD